MTQDMTRKMTIMKIMTIMTKMTIMKQHDAKVPFVGGGGLRSVLLMVLLLTFGTNVSWGQSTPFGTDYSGYYYIANYTTTKDKEKGYNVSTPASNYYLCPAQPAPDADDDYFYGAIYYDYDKSPSNQMPYLTTYKTGRVAAAMWKVEFAETISSVDYYYIRYCADNNKYLTHNTSRAKANTRLTVHLQATPGTNKESLFCFETADDNSFYIRPQKVSSPPMHINPATGNKNYYYGTGANDKWTKIDDHDVHPGGMIGYWTAYDETGYGSRWFLERVQPTISYNSTEHKIEISNIDEDVTIYYTDDGITDPTTNQTDNTGATPIVITDVNNSVSIKAIAAKSGVLPSPVSEMRIVPAATVSVGTSTITYNGLAQEPTVTVKDGDTPIPTSEYEVGYSNNVNAGDAAVVTVTNATGGNYIVYGSTTFNINPKSLTITAKPKTITYGDNPTNDGVTYSGFVEGEDESDLMGTLTYSYNYSQYGDAGDYAITPSGLSNDNYDIAFVNGTLTVNPKEVGLTWGTTTSFPYDGISHAPTANVNDADLVNGDVVGVTVTGAQTNAGSYTATAELTGEKAGNYTLPADNTQDFTITKADIAPSVTVSGWTFGETANAPVITGNTDNGTETVEYKLSSADDGTYTITVPTDAGDYTVRVTIAATTNYNGGTATNTFSIAKADIAPSVTVSGWTFGETANVPEITGNTGNGTETVEYKLSSADDGTYTITVPTDAGDYTVRVTIAETTNYNGGTTTNTFSIAQKSLGDGTAAATGITIDVTKTGDDYIVSVKDNGNDLSTDDYDVTEPGAEDNPMVWTITGKRNYKGGAVVTHETITFWKTEETAPGMQDVATYISKDVNKATPSGVTAYIVTGINMTKHALKLKPISDIPQNVPVLLLTTLTETDEENEIDFTASPTAGSTSDTDGNQLQVSTGQEVEAGQVYAFYKGKFTLTTKGTLKVDKFFLDNPNYDVATPGTPILGAPLRIVFDETTDVEEVRWMMDDGKGDQWYALDGRRLNGRPTKKGLYIRNGHKVVIK